MLTLLFIFNKFPGIPEVCLEIKREAPIPPNEYLRLALIRSVLELTYQKDPAAQDRLKHATCALFVRGSACVTVPLTKLGYYYERPLITSTVQ